MSTQRRVIALCLALAGSLAAGAADAQGKDAACLKCHSALTREPVAHAALQPDLDRRDDARVRIAGGELLEVAVQGPTR